MNKYLILEAQTARELAKQVNQALQEGYILQGGVSSSVGSSGGYTLTHFCQALVLP